MNKFTITLIMLTISVLACSTQTPQSVGINPAVKSSLPTIQPEPQYALVCMAGSLNFRSAPGTDQLVEYVFPDGQLVEVMDETETTQDGAEWRLTEYGWVNSRFLCLEKGIEQ